jgi:hypothetical protein
VRIRLQHLQGCPRMHQLQGRQQGDRHINKLKCPLELEATQEVSHMKHCSAQSKSVQSHWKLNDWQVENSHSPHYVN